MMVKKQNSKFLTEKRDIEFDFNEDKLIADLIEAEMEEAEAEEISRSDLREAEELSDLLWPSYP